MSIGSTPYTDEFYAGQAPQSLAAARVILPVVLELAPAVSVVDVGCGLGGWALAAVEAGVETVIGIDGAHVDPRPLLMAREGFHARELSAPGSLDGFGHFDLAVSLEVAEHLPPARAESFVSELVALAPAVLFSAAIPYQGGTGHVNEQWPSYWGGLFAGHGYRPVDLRPRFWDLDGVPNWYRQNMLLYVHPEHRAAPLTVGRVVDAVLPDHYLWQHEHPRPIYLRELLRALPAAVRLAVSKRVRSR